MVVSLLLFLTTNHTLVLGMQAVPIYKFTPAPARTNQFTYVSQCSRRGLCDTLSGLCNRFPGYTGEACASQDALAV